jgi:hypothetical protein
VTLVQRLWRQNLRVRLVPLRIHPTIGGKRAFGFLRSRRLHPQRIWLVVDARRLAWLVAVQRGRYALLGGKSGKLVGLTGP